MARTFETVVEFLFDLLRHGFAFDAMGIVFVRIIPVLSLCAAGASFAETQKAGSTQCMGTIMGDHSRSAFLESYCYAPLTDHIYTQGHFHGYYNVLHWYFLIVGLIFFAISEVLFNFLSGLALSRLVKDCKAVTSPQRVIELVSAAFDWKRTAPANDVVNGNSPAPLVNSVGINLSPSSTVKRSPVLSSAKLRRAQSSTSNSSFVTAREHATPSPAKASIKQSYGSWTANGRLWSSKQRYRLLLTVLGFKVAAVCCCLAFVFSSDAFFGDNLIHASIETIMGTSNSLKSIFPMAGSCNISVEQGADLRREKLQCSLTANATFIILLPVSYLIVLLAGIGMLFSFASWTYLLCRRKQDIVKATSGFLKLPPNNDIEHFASAVPTDMWVILKFLEDKNNTKGYNELWGILYREEVVLHVESLVVSTSKPKSP